MLDPNELIERTKAAGIDGICLTEHDFFWDPVKIQELGFSHQFLVLPGCEINTDDGHMLVYGLHRYVYGMHRIKELARMVEVAGGAMVTAHPYRRLLSSATEMGSDDYHNAIERAKRMPAFQSATAIETENGRGSEVQNHFSRRLARELDKAGTAGTDSHEVIDIARCATYFEADIRSLDDLIRELKAGRFYPVSLQRAGGTTAPL